MSCKWQHIPWSRRFNKKLVILLGANAQFLLDELLWKYCVLWILHRPNFIGIVGYRQIFWISRMTLHLKLKTYACVFPFNSTRLNVEWLSLVGTSLLVSFTSSYKIFKGINCGFQLFMIVKKKKKFFFFLLDKIFC